MLARRLTTIGTFGITLSAILTCKPSFAQLVQVGPGYVKAPFVRIYTDPDGGTHVRAPFTSVYTPGYRNVAPPVGYQFESPQNTRRFGSPLAAPANPLGLRSDDMNWQNLRRLAREGAAQLNQEVSRHSASQSWHDYLQATVIAELVAEDRNDPPPEEVRQRLQEILRSYDATVNANNLRSIHGRPGFRKVHAALTELVRPPLAHQRRLVATSARELQRELSALGRKGEGWVSYFQLTSPIFTDDTYDPGSESADVELEQLAKIVSQFDAVSVESEYTLISELAGFQATHENLMAYLEMRTERDETQPQDSDVEGQPQDAGRELQPKDVRGIEPVPLPVEELPRPAPNESKAPNELRRLRL